jgi:2-(1,2-epoxy-1,2-dihydrophenyl)acetyl-CoA isomerase
MAKSDDTLAPYLTVEQLDRVLLLRCKDDFAFLELDLESKEAFDRLFTRASDSEDIGAVVLLGTSRSFGSDVLDRFWLAVFGRHSAAGAISTPHAKTGMTDFRRGEAGIERLTTNIRECPKAVLMAAQGEVLTPFWGASLACDHRVVADTTVFRTRALKFGMPPGGALAYLLPAYIGHGRAADLLYSGRDVAAEEALGLGLVDHVVAPEALEATALDTAQRIAACPPEAVAATKELLGLSLRGLRAHFERETTLITRCMHAKQRRSKGH